MKYNAKFDGTSTYTSCGAIVALAEISDEEQEGMYFLFYYDKDGKFLGDSCFFSLDEAKEQVKYNFGLDEIVWNTAD